MHKVDKKYNTNCIAPIIFSKKNPCCSQLLHADLYTPIHLHNTHIHAHNSFMRNFHPHHSHIHVHAPNSFMQKLYTSTPTQHLHSCSQPIHAKTFTHTLTHHTHSRSQLIHAKTPTQHSHLHSQLLHANFHPYTHTTLNPHLQPPPYIYYPPPLTGTTRVKHVHENII